MTESSESSASRSNPSQVDKDRTKSKLGQEEHVNPPVTLSGYFAEKKIPAATFAKAVQGARLKQFEKAEYEVALDLMRIYDADGDRLWKLMSLRRLPEPLSSWIWTAARERLVQVLGSEVDLASQTPAQLVDMLRRRFPALSSTRDKVDKRAFQSSARILAYWLMQRHRLHVREIVHLLGPLVCRDESARQTTLAVVKTGSTKEFNVAVSVAFLDRSALADRELECDSAKAEASALRQQLELSAVETSRLHASIDDLTRRNADLSLKISELGRKLETHRQQSGYDFTELKAGNATLLRDRLGPLIKDAIDALEIVAPAPDVALRRLKRAISTIEETLQ